MASTRLVAMLLFGSGVCALVYQTAWLRAFRQIFGCSTPATAAVLAIFMGGLGFGALWLGPYAQRHRRPLALFSNLELGITAGAAASLLLLELVRVVYVGMGGSSSLGMVGASIVRLVLSALVLGAPILLMGGTLPAVGRAITTRADVGRKGLAVLYGFNTLGGVAGALITTFLLFEAVGVRTTLWLACALNVAVALGARALARRSDDLPTDEESVAAAVAAGTSDEPAASEEPMIPGAWILAAAFVSGFVFFLAEIVWYRMGVPILGGSTYTFGLILAMALAGIGGGGLLYALFGPRRPRPELFAITCGLEALLLLAPLALGDSLADFAQYAFMMGQARFSTVVVGWSLVAGALVLAPALVAGFQFPLLLALKGRAERGVARDVGRVYAANTLGSITGSIAGGFGLLPLLTAPGCWRLAAVLILAVGAAVCVRGLRSDGRRGSALAFATLALLTIAACFARGPTALWRHASIGVGRATRDDATFNEHRATRYKLQREVLEEREGWESSLAFITGDGLSLYTSGKSDGDAIVDAPCVVLMGLTGAILHPEPKRAFVIGLGSGETAGWLAEVPTMERVDVVELEQAVIDYAQICAAGNFDVVDHPKVELVVGDAREVLQTTDRVYDLIVSEPSSPYRAGVAGFYSVDFYGQARGRLAPDGIFVQWLQDYEVDAESFAIAIASIQRVFEHVSVWNLPPGDLIMVASAAPQSVDVTKVRERLAVEPYRTGFGRLGGEWEVEGVVGRHLARPELCRAIAEQVGDRVNTDDRPILEYRFARTTGAGAQLRARSVEVFEMARARDMHRPELVGEEVDWTRVEYLRRRAWNLFDVAPPPDEATRRLLAVQRAVRSGDYPGARALARGNPAPPAADLDDRLLLAELHASESATAETRAELAIELSALEEAGLGGEVAWLRLLSAVIDGRAAQLPALAAAAFEWARRDPWLGIDRRRVPRRTLILLNQRVREPALARALAVELLRGPFSLYMLEGQRRLTAQNLGRFSLDEEVCAQAFELDEPYPVWRRRNLEVRAACYATARPALHAQALADLQAFDDHQGPDDDSHPERSPR